MPVRNIGSIGSPKPIEVYHIIPPVSNADLKVTIETDTETIDLSDLVLSGSYTDGVTNTVGSFDFKIIDANQSIYNRISTFDEVIIYADYGTPTTARFRGKIEKRGYIDSYLTISGRSIGMIFSEKNIIYNSEGQKSIDTILTEIIEANFSSVDVTNIESNPALITVNYFEIPMSQIIEQLCGSTYDFYLNHNNEAHYFTKGSRQNETEAIMEDINAIETTDNTDDTEEVYSKVRVYGGTVSGIPIIATSDSSTTQTGGVIKELKIDNLSIKTVNQAQDLADSEYLSKNSVPRIGETSALFLPTLMPGEKLFIAIPREDIVPAYYEINTYKHEFDLNSSTWAKTTINIKRKKQTVSSLVKQRINFESEITENTNPNDMDYSLIYDFSTDEGTFTNTIRQSIDTNGSVNYVLKTVSGDSGNWKSPIKLLPSNIAGIEFRIAGDNLAGTPPEGTKIYYSFDGGTTEYLYDASVSQTIVPTGSALVIKILFSSAETQVDAVAALYKLS